MGGGGIPGGRWSGIKPGRAPRRPVDGVCSPTTGAGGGGATPWVPGREEQTHELEEERGGTALSSVQHGQKSSQETRNTKVVCGEGSRQSVLGWFAYCKEHAV